MRALVPSLQANRTMKEQAIHGRIFLNVEEVRAAALAFKDRYNREWRLEKLGFMSPLEARQVRPPHETGRLSCKSVSKQSEPVHAIPPSNEARYSTISSSVTMPVRRPESSTTGRN